LLIAYEATVTKLNIQKLFFEMGNFGQTVLTDKNLRGNVTSTIQFASVWSKTLNVNIDKIFATADVVIENGELISFEPMLKLSRFVKGTDLRNIKFSTLKNNIAIGNRKINVPLMEISSSALNITASGIHTFDNIVDYKIKMRMSELLGKKVKNLNTEFGTIEEDGMGSWHLYLSMKGPLDNPKFSYDRKSVEQNITKTIKTEKDNFLKILKEEFKNPQQKKQEEPAKKETELQLDTDEE
jgi:AsmA-like C-terminal region